MFICFKIPTSTTITRGVPPYIQVYMHESLPNFPYSHIISTNLFNRSAQDTSPRSTHLWFRCRVSHPQPASKQLKSEKIQKVGQKNC